MPLPWSSATDIAYTLGTMDCFVIMPFATTFDDVYAVIKSSVEAALPAENIRCYRLDENLHAGRITDELLAAIRRATFCVADSTDSNANVMWEIGYAMALKKPVIFLHEKSSQIPFDTQDMRAIRYDRNALNKTLRQPLQNATAATISHYKLPTVNTPTAVAPAMARTYSITGSMEANPVIVESRLGSALAPYLGQDVTWLCGSNGVVDEVAIEYLGSRGEKVEAFGYHRFDVSDNARKLLAKYGFSFYDAEVVPLPDGIDAPSIRDRLFLTKASLHFLVWNGRSTGVAELKSFFDARKVGYQIVFT